MSSKDEIEKLRALRGIPKGMITKLMNWVMENADQSSSFDVEVRLEQLRKYEEQFEKTQSQLEALDPSERAPDAVERSSFEERVASLKAQLLQLKSSHHDATFDSSMGSIHVDVVNNELPHFDIPKFDGDYRSYTQFRESFDLLVHNSDAKGMTDVRKYAILKSSLTGRALDAIRDLPITAATYNEALTILKERFENKRLIFESYVNELWDHSVANDNSSLRKVCDTFVAVLRGLERIASADEVAAGILIHLILTKCDRETVRKWEEHSAGRTDLCQRDEFLEFLKSRCVQLENVEYALKINVNQACKRIPKFHSNILTTSVEECPLCESQHFLTQCESFLKLSPYERYDVVKSNFICVRCIEDSSQHRCQNYCDKCRRPHHTLLHFERSSTNENSESSASGGVIQPGPSNVITNSAMIGNESLDSYTFLATALALVQTVDGNFVTMRVLFDGGSQTHLITERAANSLGLSRRKLNVPLTLHGIHSSNILTHVVVAKLKSFDNQLNDEVILVVHKRLRQRHPMVKIDISSWKFPLNKPLADNNFNIPSDVDIILNANKTYKYLLPGQVSLGDGKPILQNTYFGWTVVGDFESHINNNPCTNITTNSISASRTSEECFWEVETILETRIQSRVKLQVEEHFLRMYRRKQDGLIMLRVPFKKPLSLLGQSRNIAKRRLQNIIKKIESNHKFGVKYMKFVQEYIDLGHCSRTDDVLVYDYQPSTHVYITKRAVLSESAWRFDSLGLLQPIIVMAKIVIQCLWSQKFGWDDILPKDKTGSWRKYRQELDDPYSSSLKWIVELVTKLRTGKDGCIRVVKVTTKFGTYEREVAQLFPIVKIRD